MAEKWYNYGKFDGGAKVSTCKLKLQLRAEDSGWPRK
jgi:hypothetical protein